ncbi:MAG: hypothetical protein IT336_02220 [Thermomicrobiales bacterium]|nr:hypothetical protein [Thermomicrobiales bacterium]
MHTPRQQTWDIEREPWLPVGDEERFSGYGVMGLPFSSGHLLCLRRFPVTSVGPGYTAIWHRYPDGRWVFYSDADPRTSCSRYFGAALAESRYARIELRWLSPWSLVVDAPDVDLFWHIRLERTAATRLLNGVAGRLPDSAWRSGLVLGLMGRLAGRLLGAGRLTLQGSTPNGQRFLAWPREVWTIRGSIARFQGVDLGEPEPLVLQDRLGDFAISQRGIFATGSTLFEPFDAIRHLQDIQRSVELDDNRIDCRVAA